MKKKVNLLLFLFLLSIGITFAQTRVTGSVVDESGEPVIGASIQIKGTGQGTVTDIDGNFTLSVPAGSNTLVVSYVGMMTREMPVSSTMRIVLASDTELLDEVVVVGYGTQRRVNLTGAVSNVDVGEAVASRPVTDVAKALQGVTPGLTITNNLGGLGLESNIRLRGSVGSINAQSGTSPLILVDNVEVPSLNLINPDDIETISVLKDAASTTIYGTRAAWGVILITTKAGRLNESVKINYSNNFAWGTPTIMAKTAKASDNADWIMNVLGRYGNTEITNIGYSIDATAVQKIKEWEKQYGGMSQAELGEMKEGRDFEIRGGKTFFYRSFDPVEEFIRKWTPQQNHSLSLTGGSDKTSFNISLGYLNQGGVMKFNSDEYNRMNVTSNTTTRVRDWWRFRTNIMFSRTNSSQPYRYTSGQYDAWNYLLRWPRWYPYATYDGKEFRSAVTDIKAGNRESENANYVRVNLGTEINPIQNLAVNFDYTFSVWNNNVRRNGGKVMAYDMFVASPFNSYKDLYGSTHNRAVQASQYTLSHIYKAYATYNYTVNDIHNFKFMTGFDAETRSRTSHYSERRGLISVTLPEIKLATGEQFSYDNSNAYSYNNDFAAAGVFGRINYDYMQKYLLELNARYDGSSRFPAGKKWAFFPSVSAGWRVSEEPFMQSLKPTLYDLKLRGSWGTIGNQDVAANTFLSTMSSGNSGWIEGGQNLLYVSAPSVISPSLTWERVTTKNFGIDARLLNNDLGFTMDIYQRVTSDMHSPGETLPLSFGVREREWPRINYGELTSNGIEFGMDYSHKFASGLGISARANIWKIKEVITKYNNATKNIYGYYEGKRLGEIWGYESDRLFQADDFNADGTLRQGIPSQALYESGAFKFGPGDMKYKDLDGSGVIDYGTNTVDDHGDLKVIGNSLPNFEYSFNLGADYKGFDISVFFQGVGSRDYWAYGAVGIPGGGAGAYDAIFEHQLDYWTPQNTDAFYPRASNMGWLSNNNSFLRQTRYLQDMSYLRLKNLTVGYTLPTDFVHRLSFQSARFYFSGENLFEFTNMTVPLDPESTAYKVGVVGETWSFGRSYPFMRLISFGMQIVF